MDLLVEAAGLGCIPHVLRNVIHDDPRPVSAVRVGTLSAMEQEKVRLGGMALQNGVLVHGPTAWGAAVRDDEGKLHVASGVKPRFGDSVQAPVLRGPLRLAEAFALLPALRRALPQARFPFERPAVVGSMVVSSLAARTLRRPGRATGGRELAAGAMTLLPAILALRGPNLAEYHGAEHVSIGTYENGGERAPKEHPRCGSQLVAPMLASSLAANAAAARVRPGARGLARLVGTTAAVGASIELFAWMARNPDNPLAKALARPGYELQKRFSTAEPSEAQVEVANAARDACLALELRSAQAH
jgi:Protein of unknown function (DUF1385)